MGRKVYNICDRCGAQFESGLAGGEHPIQSTEWKIPIGIRLGGGFEVKHDLCHPCRRELRELIQAFLDRITITCGGRTMNDLQFRALLDIIMVSDPSPLANGLDTALVSLAEQEAKARGWGGWSVAYHEHMKGR